MRSNEDWFFRIGIPVIAICCLIGMSAVVIRYCFDDYREYESCISAECPSPFKPLRRDGICYCARRISP